MHQMQLVIALALRCRASRGVHLAHRHSGEELAAAQRSGRHSPQARRYAWICQQNMILRYLTTVEHGLIPHLFRWGARALPRPSVGYPDFSWRIARLHIRRLKHVDLRSLRRSLPCDSSLGKAYSACVEADGGPDRVHAIEDIFLQR